MQKQSWLTENAVLKGKVLLMSSTGVFESQEPMIQFPVGNQSYIKTWQILSKRTLLQCSWELPL